MLEEIDRARAEEETAMRMGDLNRAAELKYGVITELEGKLASFREKLAGVQAHKRMLKEEVEAEDVAQVASRWTGIPVAKMLEGEVHKLLEMEQRLARRVVGQRDAIVAVANAVRRARSGLADPNRPIGSFLFLGPTGVGKTELARALAEFLFDDENSMVRVDMSEYMERHAVSRLIGAPPGYVGYDQGGALTEAVRRRPYAVILFDEIEKAHPDVFNVLLQLLDDGRLTDGQGHVVDFKNTVVIMTSNLGSDAIQDAAGDEDAIRARVLAALRVAFRPEFLNRVDETVIFHSLGLEQLAGIADIQLARLVERLSERDLSLALTPAAKAHLAELGFDPVYGARPLKRAIQQHLLDPLATQILSGDIPPGSHVVVEPAGDAGSLDVQAEFSFSPEPHTEAGGDLDVLAAE